MCTVKKSNPSDIFILSETEVLRASQFSNKVYKNNLAQSGSVSEWLKETVSKTVIPERVSEVRILPLPPCARANYYVADHRRWRGKVVEGDGFEKRYVCKGIVSSPAIAGLLLVAKLKILTKREKPNPLCCMQAF